MKQYRLSKSVDLNSGKKTEQKIVGQYYTFSPEQLVVGRRLWFRDVDHPLGHHDEGEIVAIRNEVIRKRDYLIVSTKIRDYYLTEYVRKDKAPKKEDALNEDAMGFLFENYDETLKGLKDR